MYADLVKRWGKCTKSGNERFGYLVDGFHRHKWSGVLLRRKDSTVRSDDNINRNSTAENFLDSKWRGS